MNYIVDFHIHSRYSRATSKNMNLEKLDEWAKIKGIQVLGTGDFTHPQWFKDLEKKLVSEDNGLYVLKSKITGKEEKTYFIITSEISCVYKKNDKARRLHLLIIMPSLEAAKKINQRLEGKYNLESDGRPILGIDAKELAKIILDISPEAMVIPAHAWTPWYAIFGSMSGFDSLEECFEELTPKIFAIETGLSSDPLMNWQLSKLDNVTLISNSDAHSPENLGREANVFNLTELNYKNIYQAIKTRKGFEHTIEFFPEEGKYHFDGHRLCGIVFTPEESLKHKNICPVCKKELVLGVLHRVNDLADRAYGFRPAEAVPYKYIVPLKEIIAEALNKTKISKIVDIEYFSLIKKGGSEFHILLDLEEDKLKKITSLEIAGGILNARREKVTRSPGYDGVYGRISVLNGSDKAKKISQEKLF